MGRVKSVGVLVGLLYFMAFLLILPYVAASDDHAISGTAQLFAAGIIAVVVVQILLNWAAISMAAAPLVWAASFAVVGWVIWLFAPLAIIPINVMTGMILAFFPGAGTAATANYQFIVDFLTRMGQFLMALGAAFWWVARKLLGVNQLAIGVYVVSLGLLGILSGVWGLGPVMVFLLVWLVVYTKLSDQKNLPDLKRIFQVVAAIALLVNMGVTHSLLLRIAGGGAPVFAIGASPNSAAMGFARSYEFLLDLLLLFGVWSPARLWGWIPQRTQTFVLDKFRSAAGLLRLPS